MDLILTALIGLTSLVGTVTLVAAAVVFGPGLAKRLWCWLAGHAFAPSSFGSPNRCRRCGEER